MMNNLFHFWVCPKCEERKYLGVSQFEKPPEGKEEIMERHFKCPCGYKLPDEEVFNFCKKFGL